MRGESIDRKISICWDDGCLCDFDLWKKKKKKVVGKLNWVNDARQVFEYVCWCWCEREREWMNEKEKSQKLKLFLMNEVVIAKEWMNGGDWLMLMTMRLINLIRVYWSCWFEVFEHNYAICCCWLTGDGWWKTFDFGESESTHTGNQKLGKW